VRKPENVGRSPVFVRQSDAAHQAIVCIQRHAKSIAVIDLERMVFNLCNSSCVNIARQTDFQWDAFIEHILRQRSHADDYSILNRHVFDEPRCMPDPMGTAPLNGLPDGLFAERFTGMDRNVEVLALNVMKSIDVFLRRISSFFTCKVETHDSVRPKVDGKFCNLLRNGR
jgi:hypothetical protein